MIISLDYFGDEALSVRVKVTLWAANNAETIDNLSRTSTLSSFGIIHIVSFASFPSLNTLTFDKRSRTYALNSIGIIHIRRRA